MRLTRNVAAITMDFDGIERADVRALGGADTVTVNDLAAPTSTAPTSTSPAFDGTGDGAADTVIANGTAGADDVDVGSDAGGSVVVDGLAARCSVDRRRAGADNVNVATLGGDDTIAAGVGFTGPAPSTSTAATGADTTTYSGTSAADTIGVARNGTRRSPRSRPARGRSTTTAVEDLVVHGPRRRRHDHRPERHRRR